MVLSSYCVPCVWMNAWQCRGLLLIRQQMGYGIFYLILNGLGSNFQRRVCASLHGFASPNHHWSAIKPVMLSDVTRIIMFSRHFHVCHMLWYCGILQQIPVGIHNARQGKHRIAPSGQLQEVYFWLFGQRPSHQWPAEGSFCSSSSAQPVPTQGVRKFFFSFLNRTCKRTFEGLHQGAVHIKQIKIFIYLLFNTDGPTDQLMFNVLGLVSFAYV